MTRSPGELLVAEVFGPTVQGEGPSVGQRAVFVRLSGCSLSCSWCDTPYTWDSSRFDLRSQRQRVHVDGLAARVLAVDVPLVVVTGGEPLLQADALAPLVVRCRAAGRRVEVETNGTVTPPGSMVDAGVCWNVSPKLANSGLPFARRVRPEVLRVFAGTGQAVFKFVVTSPGDLREVADLQRRFGLSPVWVMPEGQTAEDVLRVSREIADTVIARGWNLTTRLHVLLWGCQRGR